MASPQPVSSRARPRGLELKPGTVRSARIAAGLSLAAVAQADISRAALSQIEQGRIRPTAETLLLIGQRLGRPISDFLVPGQEQVLEASSGAQLQFQLDDLERLCAMGDWRAALEVYESLQAAPLNDSGRAWADVLGGQALVQTGEPGAAEPRLREAVRSFDRMGNPIRHAEALERLAIAEQALEDPACEQTAQKALAICRGLQPRPVALEVRLLNRLGSVYDGQNRWEEAIKAYELAAARSDELRDLNRMARAFNGLAIAYKALGNLAEARAYSQRAITIHEMFRDTLAIASAENNLGLVLIQLGRHDEARGHLERSLSLCDEQGIDQGRAHVLLSLAELDLAQERFDGALARATEALALAGSRREAVTLAAAHELAGQALEAIGGDPAAVEGHFQAAFAALEALSMRDRLSAAHVRYADLLEARGDEPGASKHWRLAALAAHPELERASGRRPRSSAAGA